MSVEQDKKIQSLYASLKNVMTQNLDKDEQEQLLEWVHKLIIDMAYEKKKVDILSKMRPLKGKTDSESKRKYLKLKTKRKNMNQKIILQISHWEILFM